MTDDISSKIIALIAEQAMLEPDEVKMESTPEELGLDSLGMVEIVFAIEEAFDISVPFNANDPGKSAFDVSTVGSVVAAVRRLIAEQS
jgi:acyl carrier protein